MLESEHLGYIGFGQGQKSDLGIPRNSVRSSNHPSEKGLFTMGSSRDISVPNAYGDHSNNENEIVYSENSSTAQAGDHSNSL